MVDNRLDTRFYRSLGPIRLSQLIEGFDVKISDPSVLNALVLHGASLETSQSEDVVFLESKKRLNALSSVKAKACFVKPALAEQVKALGIFPIISEYPRAHFARALLRLYGSKEACRGDRQSSDFDPAYIHPTAIISADAVLGDGVHIGPYTVIGHGVSIGPGSVIGSHSDIQFAILGENCTVKSGSVIGGAGFGVAHDENGVVDIPHFGRVILQDRVSIGSQTCVDRGQLGDTYIGSDTKIDNLVQIAHNVKIGKSCAIAGHSGISGSCEIGDFVLIGGSVGLADHVKISDKVSIAARSGVMHDIPYGETWFGTPAQPIRDQMRMISRMRKLGASSKVKPE